MWILPMLATAVVATGNRADIEQALTAGLRARVTAGWEIADLRTEIRSGHDEMVVTMVDGDAVERHVIAFGGDATYRVETDAALPPGPTPPAAGTIAALSAPNGGLEIADGCGEYSVLSYFVEDAARDGLAPRLVASTLATADDLTWVGVGDDRATFAFERDGRAMTLIASLDRAGQVVAAEIRWYGGDADAATTYRDLRSLKRVVRHRRVTRITSGHGGTVVVGRRRFAIDPDDTAFDYGEGDSEEYEGCGC